MDILERARAARVLGVDIMATPEQVRDAFRRRAREVHPDKVGGDSAGMAELNAEYEALSARAGDGWEFSGASTPSPQGPSRPTIDDDATFTDFIDRPVGGWSLLRAFPMVLGVVGVVITTIVFVAAIGYDWSLSP